MSNKTELTIELEQEQIDWLAENVVDFGLPDESKAARVLFAFAMSEIDVEEIFSSDNSKCLCG
ncbi:MAG: hypothetical protein CL750_00705 [Chloroflexi bacterium]|nr:MAG: hypothetical protein EGP10_02250 [SAR202 cluster bacterium]MBA13873.1 hypothetical protein [Chloroflexota bacterium]|tara:strand:+ start:187 stop:375 length:189 start_codon:yes stop_codon:yes gene_type:complete